MINNLLRAVAGTDSDLLPPLSPASSSGPTSGPSSPEDGSTPGNRPGNDLAAAVGGWIAGVHETVVDAASSGRTALSGAGGPGGARTPL